jgi:lysophospholipase L1-like esterase
MSRTLVTLGCCLMVLASRSPFAAAAAADDAVIFDMETVRHKPTEISPDGKQKVPAGTAELVDGHAGRAVKFTFVENARGGFMAAGVRATPQWDAAAGFSFWVKGDGSSHWGGIELIDKADFGLRYGYCFPIDSTEWRKITVPWGDLVPELKAPRVDAKAGYHPSNFGNFWFGKWHYWREYPAESYAVDDVRLEQAIDVPPPLPPVEPGLTRVRAKLAAHKPITVVTMGDSLSDQHHWSNRRIVWHQFLAEALRAKYGCDVKIVNPAIGGTTLSQNVVLIPRWVKEAPSPDLVTIWFGTNDWDSGVRGERFKEYLRLAVDQIRRQTKGSADVLIMTTAPTHARWETYAELERAARDVAAEKTTGLADTAGEFRRAGSAEEALKEGYWEWDKVHLGRKGHEAARDAVVRAIEGGE